MKNLQNLITQLNNAQLRKKEFIIFNFKFSNIRNKQILIQFIQLLEDYGYIKTWSINKFKESNTLKLKIFLIFDDKGYSTFNNIDLFYKVNSKIILNHKDLWSAKFLNNDYILLTSKGLMFSNQASLLNLGGILICKIS